MTFTLTKKKNLKIPVTFLFSQINKDTGFVWDKNSFGVSFSGSTFVAADGIFNTKENELVTITGSTDDIVDIVFSYSGIVIDAVDIKDVRVMPQDHTFIEVVV